jgi:hypothetical protein
MLRSRRNFKNRSERLCSPCIAWVGGAAGVPAPIISPPPGSHRAASLSLLTTLRATLEAAAARNSESSTVGQK